MSKFQNFIQVPRNITWNNIQTAIIDILVVIEKKNRDDIIVRHGGISLTQRDIIRVIYENKWINDQVINYYFILIRERNIQRNLDSVYIFDTFFYTSLLRKGFEAVFASARYADKTMFDHKFILIPVHVFENHWALVVINNDHKTITVYNSNNTEFDSKFLKVYFEFCVNKHKLREKIPCYSLATAKNISKQRTDNDCGIYTMLYAEYVTRNDYPSNLNNKIPSFKNKIFLELLNTSIIDLPDPFEE